MPVELFLAVVKEYRRCVVLAGSLKDGINKEDIDLEGLKLLYTVSSSPGLLCSQRTGSNIWNVNGDSQATGMKMSKGKGFKMPQLNYPIIYSLLEHTALWSEGHLCI